MLKRLRTFTFEREARWLVALYVVIPLLAIVLCTVLPALWRRWFS
jgi:hypothetical protein